MTHHRYAEALPALPPGRPRLATALYAAARLLAALAAALAAHATRKEPLAHREFAVVEREGRPVGMVYEDGRLVALLPEVGRL